MQKEVTPLNWEKDLKNQIGDNIKAIDDDFLIFDNVKIIPTFDYPFKIDMTMVIICTKGTARGKIGMKSYETKAPSVIILLANEILQYEYISDDFEGLFIAMSKRMTDNFLPYIQERMPLAFTVRTNPSIPLNKETLDIFKTYYYILKHVVDMKENDYRKEIIHHVTLAFYYHSSSQLHQLPPPERKPTKNEESVVQFFDLVEKYYKTERQVGFYAEKIHRTPKYLSQVIKQSTGKSANDWIDEYVMLEAKALLKSSKLTIQQISDELNFTDQSIFGKYFKRIEGVSPKEYREK